MKEIICCEFDKKLENIIIKIKEYEHLSDLRKKFEKMEYENLFFYKKDSSLIKNKDEEKNIKIIDCLIENEIKFSINLKLIITIENENKKIIEYDFENSSLIELRKKLGNEINPEFKFFNEKGVILDEDKTFVFDIIKKNEILIKKISENMCKFLKIETSNLKNNKNIEENKDNIKGKNDSEEFDNDIDENINNPNVKIYDNKTILKDKENSCQKNVLIDKNTNNDMNNNKLDLKKYKHLKIKSIYEYYLYPNDKFNKEEEKNCISLLLIGESGVGKSTFINSFINFIMNVKNSDEHRFKIVIENKNNNNNKEFLSQTKEINTYYIKSRNGYPPIKIIDTPGFGDTQGIEYDKKIMSMIFDKFKTINELTSVCIISKSNNTRLTFLEKYIYNNVVKLFAKDLISNFIFLFTFCDNQQPLSLKLFENNSFLNNIIKKIKEPWFLEFNNSGFFTEDQNLFTEDFVNLCYDSFNKLINKLKTLNNCSLKLSNEINEKRIELDNIYITIQNNINALCEKNYQKYKEITNDDKKQILNIFYKYENFIQEYNNISIAESKENLNDFLLELNEKNNINKKNQKLINDILNEYYEKKKLFENKTKFFDDFLDIIYND